MTEWPLRVIFGCRNNATNRESMRRLGVAIFTPGYTLAQRRQLLLRTRDPDPADPELENFHEVWLNGNDVEVLLGAGSFTETEWDRLSDAIVNFLANIGGPTVKYAVLRTLDGDTFTLTSDHNVAALAPFVGQVMTEDGVKALAGLKIKPGVR